jgi:DNA polymerase III delta prime subunit
MVRDEFLWVEKYRPKTISDCVLPEELKSAFQKFVDMKEIPNLLLTGGPGVGKTTVARAMLEQVGADYIVINGSMNGNIDTLRNDIQQFASSVSLSGGRKYVILDEADYLNANSTQPALRNFMEEFSRNCGFILTCNFKNRIIEPLHSRCSVVEFKIPKSSLPLLAGEFFKRTLKILTAEGIGYDKATIAELIQRHVPDWRRVLNELQRYSVNGSIDTGIFANLGEDNFKTLIGLLKEKKFTEMRKWVGENSDMDSTSMFRKFYDTAHEYMKAGSIADLVILLSRYQYQAAFVADQEVNLAAFLTEVMMTVEFK